MTAPLPSAQRCWGRCGVELADKADELYKGVPARTVRSWHQRFSAHVEDLSARFNAVCVEWGGELPRAAPDDAPSEAVSAIAAAWRAHRRRAHGPVVGAWTMANIVVGGALLSTRVGLPGPLPVAAIGRSRGP